ncbi:MAG TPA: TolC family protein [Bryobacteraceae bacterium]|nr:TolC family protein [Bryobacteraceae bacterium]
MNLHTAFPALALFAAGVCVPAEAQYGATTGARPRIVSGGFNFSSEDQFQGSVAVGEASSTALELSLQEAIDRGIKNNLGLLVRGSLLSAARAERLRALSALLPSVTGAIAQTETQIDLAVYGLHVAGFPQVVGPFHYTDARAYASSSLLDWTSIKNLRSTAESARAAELSAQDGRDLVVQAVASGYLAVLADAGRVDAARTQAQTAQALYNAARDRHQAGLSAAIDELRAQVEMKTQQQRLVAAENALARDKLALGRVIGLPSGQEFRVTDAATYSPLESLEVGDLLQKAYETRADYRAGQAQVRAAELAREGADAQRYPTAALEANYGAIGQSLNNSHGTFTVAASVSFNIFDAGRIHSAQHAADAEIQRRRGELADLRGKIDFEVRAALLALNTAAQQVALARSNLDLASQTLEQARDRFSAGVADNIEVVQAQEALAGASEEVIDSLFAHNLAKVALARAVGGAEVSLKQYLGGK